jgi:hypothetical protein
MDKRAKFVENRLSIFNRRHFENVTYPTLVKLLQITVLIHPIYYIFPNLVRNPRTNKYPLLSKLITLIN